MKILNIRVNTIFKYSYNPALKKNGVRWKSSAGPSSTIDDKEMETFTLYKDHMWQPYGIFQPLHSFNEIRVPFVRDSLVEYVPGDKLPLANKKIIDVGCGGGILTEALAALGADVVGLDATEDMIKVADEHSKENTKLLNKPTYIHNTIEEFVKSHRNEFDAMVASEVIEHVNNRKMFAKSCVDVVKPGGKVIFTTPNRTLFARIWYIWFFAVIGLVPKGIHEIDKFVTYKELKAWLEEYNCYEEKSHGIWYHIIPNRWEFVESKKMQFAICTVKKK